MMEVDGDSRVKSAHAMSPKRRSDGDIHTDESDMAAPAARKVKGAGRAKKKRDLRIVIPMTTARSDECLAFDNISEPEEFEGLDEEAFHDALDIDDDIFDKDLQEMRVDSWSSNSDASQPRRSRARVASNKPPDFVVKLYAMFKEVPSLIMWDSGRIVIPGHSSVLAEVLTKYFRTGKFTSFQRQLNNFGFHKKISESSSKMRVYVRADMMGFPPEALLELRRKQGVAFASWDPPASPDGLRLRPEDIATMENEVALSADARPRELNTSEREVSMITKPQPRKKVTMKNQSTDTSDIPFHFACRAWHRQPLGKLVQPTICNPYDNESSCPAVSDSASNASDPSQGISIDKSLSNCLMDNSISGKSEFESFVADLAAASTTDEDTSDFLPLMSAVNGFDEMIPLDDADIHDNNG